MIECSFTFPTQHSGQARRSMQVALVTRHGGFTRFSASGGWRSGDGDSVCEAVYYYVVAVESNADIQALHDMVARELRVAGESAMFWKVDHQLTISIEALS